MLRWSSLPVPTAQTYSLEQLDPNALNLLSQRTSISYESSGGRLECDAWECLVQMLEIRLQKGQVRNFNCPNVPNRQDLGPL
jgi:hypothetical protein